MSSHIEVNEGHLNLTFVEELPRDGSLKRRLHSKFTMYARADSAEGHV